jgi:hypothetical protein
LTREDVRRVGRELLKLLALYRGPQVRKNERAIDPVVMAYLRGAGYTATRQHNVWMYGSRRPHRIDFRVAGNPRSVIELAVRPPRGRYELSAEANHKELRKMARVIQRDAHMRFLVLLDLSITLGPVPRNKLEGEYAGFNAGRGNFTRNPVRVVYVHSEDEYDFCWSPWAR